MRASHESLVALKPEHQDSSGVIVTLERQLSGNTNWRLRRQGPSTLEYRVPINWRSWGETVRIDLEDDSVRIRSRCRFPLQLVAWGKNRANVERVRSHIRSMRDSHARSLDRQP